MRYYLDTKGFGQDNKRMNNNKMKRIALIHALPFSIDPVRQAFEEHWPEAELVNLLDDSLSVDLQRAQVLSEDITNRIVTLGEYALSIGADGILYTCSAFGKAIDIVKQNLNIPVLKPNEAMFEEVLQFEGNIGMLATFGPSVPSMEAEFNEYSAELKKNVPLKTILVDQAMTMLSGGDTAGHNRTLRQAAAEHFADFDIVMLAQFSTAQASAAVSEVFKGTILTSPNSAVLKLKHDIVPEGT